MQLVYAPPAGHESIYYQLSQLGAFALYVGLLLAQGRRRGYAWRQWVPLVAAATLALLLGSQLIFLAPAQWPAWLGGNAAAQAALGAGPRSVLGGAVVSLLVVLALRRPLGLGRSGGAVLDAFAGPLCWALAVQCLGCVAAGCCWGEVAGAGVPALQYGPGSLPYLAQQARGLLPAGAARALPVVPTQIYHLLLCAGVGGLLLGLRRRAAAWPGGTRFWLALGLLTLGRAGIEGARDPLSEPLLGSWLDLSGGQLGAWQVGLGLTGGLLLGLAAWCRWRPAARPAPLARPTAARPGLVALGLLAATAWLGPGVMQLPELLALKLLLGLVLLGEARAAWLRLAHSPLRRWVGWGPVGGLAAVLLVGMAQVPAAPDTLKPAVLQRTVTVSGGAIGSYHENLADLYSPGGCGGSTKRLSLAQQVRAAGAEVAVTRVHPAQPGYSSTWGGGLWLGQQTIHLQPILNPGFTPPPATTEQYPLANLHGYYESQTSRRSFILGSRLGLHLGSLGYYSFWPDGVLNPAGQIRQGPQWLVPELMLRVGHPRLYAQGDFGYGAENALGAATGRLALGSSLRNGGQLLLGYANSAHYPTPHLAFLSASLRLPGRGGLSPLSLEPYWATDFGRHQLFSLKLHYRLGK